jgi:hypothetical protein
MLIQAKAFNHDGKVVISSQCYSDDDRMLSEFFISFLQEDDIERLELVKKGYIPP